MTVIIRLLLLSCFVILRWLITVTDYTMEAEWLRSLRAAVMWVGAAHSCCDTSTGRPAVMSVSQNRPGLCWGHCYSRVQVLLVSSSVKVPRDCLAEILIVFQQHHPSHLARIMAWSQRFQPTWKIHFIEEWLWQQLTLVCLVGIT